MRPTMSSTTTTTTTTTTANDTTSTAAALPDLTSYRSVHHAIRSAAHRLAMIAPAVGPADRIRVHAIRRYWDGFTGEIVGHHTLEDDVFFPALAERSARMRELVDRLEADHHLLDELMDETTATIARFDRPGAPERAAQLLGHVASHMDEHLDVEDDQVLPLFAQQFSADEYLVLEDQAMKSLGFGKQAFFTVPFVVDSMSEPERTQMVSSAPMPMRVLYRATRRRFARLERAVFRGASMPNDTTSIGIEVAS
jgi:hemerythrin-like domain-containing protein